ncbi:hypothetical protein IAT38_005527 [Cryptococcus sp. DSM 104549]
MPSRTSPALIDAILRYYPLAHSTSSNSPSSPPSPLAPTHPLPPARPSRPSRHSRASSLPPPTLTPFTPYTALHPASRFIPSSPPQPPPPPPPTHQPTNSIPPHIHSPIPRSHSNSPTFAHLSASRRTSRDNLHAYAAQGGKDNMPDDTHLSSPQNIGGRSSRTSPSPSRPPKLSALSPLQTFSPLQPVKTAPPGPAGDAPATTGTNSAASGGGRSRAGSVTRSLSRRDSVVAQAARWGSGEGNYDEEQTSPRNLFSRLTLVKAPAEKPGLGRHGRSKSSSSLAPFSSFAAAADAPATSARGPRRSFAASSFGGFSPLQPLKSPSGDQPSSLHRVHSHHDDNSVGIQRKVLSPSEVVDIARSLNSPVMMPQGGFNGAELKRRKSAGSVLSRSAGAGSLGSSFGGGGSLGLSGSLDRSPERPPVALEPVEYVQMEDDILLPFVDRCDEVLELMAHPANAKLFKLLRAAFPKEPARADWRELAPEEWRWDELVEHLTKVGRTERADYEWVFAARRAVRQRSVALWEKLGVCLGCDEALMNVGSEDDSPPSWGGLGLTEDDDDGYGGYEPMMNQVWIAGLEAVDPDEQARAERQFVDEFGEIVEDEGEQAAAGMSALLGPMTTIGEEPTASIGGGPGGGLGQGKTRPMSMSRQTPAQRAGNRDNIDPILGQSAESSPPRLAKYASHRTSTASSRAPPPAPPGPREVRSKSFVGLQICTSPTLPAPGEHGAFARSPTSGGGSSLQTPLGGIAALPVYERGPGSPMFPSSFSSLSVEPNLGRSASGAGGGVRPPQVQDEFQTFQRRGLVRKPSGAGLSESAITFVSESDYSGGH